MHTALGLLVLGYALCEAGGLLVGWSRTDVVRRSGAFAQLIGVLLGCSAGIIAVSRAIT
ncbi:hypothetical protein [Methylobacterium iners]|uniref:Uncharacterized protein n=1 Tax=Methylobacterium iners TaxID=418707 RepID=A0ABQ4S8M4_9HYPH|nr:hypothetical protein [Methylobacterium iners]GJD98025.1 hypothetical protein OCOJLMKI_5264 [Methylobacterium iners]